MLTLVASALLCCPPVAQVSYANYGYAQPAYGGYVQQQYAPTYQQTYQTPYAQFQANPAAFAESVASYVRKQDAARAAAQQQADILAKVNQLGVIVEKLAAQPPPSPPFQAPQASPQYQAPPVPSKQAPQFEAPPPPLAQPPVPSKSSYGPAGGPSLPPTTPATPDFNGFQSYAPSPPVSLVQALTRCAECHTGPGSKRGVVIFDSPGVLANLGLDQRLEMLDAVRSGRMPPRSAPDPVVAAAILQSIQADVSSLASNSVGGTRR